MKKIVLTGLFVFGFIFSGTSISAMGGEIHLVGKDGVVTNQLKYTQTLRRGIRNANVLALQKKLKAFGFYHKALDADYGSGTIAAVKQFQRAKGLKVDGIAGPKTFAMVLATDATLLSTGGIKSVKPIAGICTKEYKPVCGKIDTGVRCISSPCEESTSLKTFSNACMAKLAHADILYKGKCKITHIDILPINDTPKVITKPATNITAYHAYLNGVLDDLGGVDKVETFFVIAHDDENIDGIEDEYNTFSSIPQNGLLKIYFNDMNSEGDFTKYITGYINNNTNYYRACGQYEDSNNNDHIVCGDVEKFTTLFSDSNGGDCLKIQGGSSNKTVHIGNTTDFTTFEIENLCSDDVEINKIKFKVISSYNKVQVEDIYLKIDDDDFDEGVDINQSYNPYVGGPVLTFEANGSFNLDSGDKVDLEIGGDIESIYSGWNGIDRHYTAFAISLDSIEFEYDNEEEADYRDYWSNLVVVDY